MPRTQKGSMRMLEDYVEELMRVVDHRTSPLPTGRPMMFQGWDFLLFAHWRCPQQAVRALVPPQLELDTFDGAAWITLVPFRMRDVHVLGTKTLGHLSTFPELNLRTYVRYQGVPGLYFLSLDTTSLGLTLAARTMVGLPYFIANMAMRCGNAATRIRSDRRITGGCPARLVAEYRPTGGAMQAPPGTLEHFLVEWYRLYSVRKSGHVVALDVHHRPWSIAPAEARFKENSMLSAAMLHHAREPDLLHYSARQDVLLWPPETMRG